MVVPHDPQPSKPTPGGPPPFSLARSMTGFRNWWAQRAFRLAPDEARAETPAALRDAAVQFSSRVWEIAAVQARQQLEAERATVNERVAEANAKVQQATLARGRAENHAAQLEKRLAAAEKTRQDVEKQLTAAGAKQQELQTQLKALEQARGELQKRLDEAGARSAEQEKQLAALRAEIAEHDAKAERFEEDQQRQLEKAKQHYAALESQLATLLETHKSARQGFEKSSRGRD
ncbi:MAG TPA: hypothetical protein VKT74_07410 [Gammaproteobacteria bacterium]|nr:hypothetical protein [Gammaproteobacteria bacterium]